LKGKPTGVFQLKKYDTAFPIILNSLTIFVVQARIENIKVPAWASILQRSNGRKQIYRETKK